jgi:hypothetical protein
MIFIGQLFIQCIIAIGDQNTIDNTDRNLMSIIPSYPALGSQSCEGIYVIDKNVKEAVLMSSHNHQKQSYI